MAQALLLNDDDDDDKNKDESKGKGKGKGDEIRKTGKIVNCEEIDNGNESLTLNGEMRILNIANNEWNEEIFFYAPTSLQLAVNDLMSFCISYFDDGRPYATNLKIVKYGGVRYSAHIEVLAADILRCCIFKDAQNIEVAVDGRHCVNADSGALHHGSEIEFSLSHDERSNLWTAQRILLLETNKNKKKNKNKKLVDVDEELNDLFDIELSGQIQNDSIMDSIAMANDDDNNNKDLIAHNPPDIVWIEDNERKYKTTKTSINYDHRIYIDLPYDCEDKLRGATKKLKELRPFERGDRVSEYRKQQIFETQRHCVFLWIKHFCLKIIKRRTSIPSFIKFESLFQLFFAQIMDEYIQTKIECDDAVFITFKNRLNDIIFMPELSLENEGEKEEKKEDDDEEEKKQKQKKKKKSNKAHHLLRDCFDDWASRNVIKYYRETLHEIEGNTNIYINGRNNEPLKQAARCLNKLRPKYTSQINNLSQDVLFKINYWKRNAHFCLVRFCIMQCIEKRLTVPHKICVNKDHEANEDEKQGDTGGTIHSLAQLEEYTKLCDIVDVFHSLYLDDADESFDNLLISCTEIVLNVPDDILGIDSTEFKQNIDVAVAEVSGKGNSVYITDKSDGGRFHRLYFFSPYLSYVTHPVHVQLNDISPQLYRMTQVFLENLHLLFLDICIPWKLLNCPSSLNVSFHYKTDKGWIMTPSASKLENNNRGFYCVHKQTQTESLLGSFSRMFKKFTSNEYSLQKSAETAIVRHLLADITDWASYRYSRMIMNSLSIVPETYKTMWKEQLVVCETQAHLVNVHKLQLLKSINPKSLPDVTAQSVFAITRACLEEDSVLLQNEYNQQTMGVAIYNSFVGDLRRTLNYVPSHLISTADRICLFPCFNFFRYFQDLKERINEAKRAQQRAQGAYSYGYGSGSGYGYNSNYNNRLSDYELKRVDFNRDMDWIEHNMVDVLDVDLRIATFQTRPWPLETIILNFCKTLSKNDKDGTQRMIEIFARLNTMKGSESIFGRIFNNTKNVNCIFFLLHTDFMNWSKFCHCISEQFIRKTKRVHRIFIEKLEKKIESLQNMSQLHALLNLLKEFKCLNRLVIRMKLLRNITLLETTEWRQAVDIIMQIVWKHARIDEDNADMLQHCTAELLFNLLKRENQREFGLKLFIEGSDDIDFLKALEPSDDRDMCGEMEDEDDLYASSDEEDDKKSATTNTIIKSHGLDDDTSLAIALSASHAQKEVDIEKGIKLVVIPETKEKEKKDDDDDDGKDDMKEDIKALPIIPRRKKKKKKKEKAQLVDKKEVFHAACMEALEQILQTKTSIPEKISMFCAHEIFYKLPETIHVLYVELVMQGANKDLAKWGEEDTADIKQISMQYATMDRENGKGVKLWDLLLHHLIHLPLDTHQDVDDDDDEEETDAYDEDDIVAQPLAQDVSHLPAFLQQLIQQQGQKQSHNIVGNAPPPPPPMAMMFKGNIIKRKGLNEMNKKREKELHNEFLDQITYCISCQPWIEFAMSMKHLSPMHNLLTFINTKLDNLQCQISYQTLPMLCADLLGNEECRFKKLLINIKHRMLYDSDVDAVITNYRHWYKLREHLIIMFRRYIKIDDTAGKDIQELNHFLEYLKQWNHISIMDIDEKIQWKLLEEYEDILNVLNERQFSEVFLRLWYQKRVFIEKEQKSLYEKYRIKKNIVLQRDNKKNKDDEDGKQDEKDDEDDDDEAKLPDLFGENESDDDVEELYGKGGKKKFHCKPITYFEWSFELYMTELYDTSCATWNILVTSVSNRKLKIADLDWFIDLELSKELKIMKLQENTINKVHLYAGEALKLQPLLRFTSDLVQVVQLIVEYMKKIDDERSKKGMDRQCRIEQDKNWKGLVKKLSNGEQLKRDQPIADAAKMYEDVSKSIGIDFSKLHRNWLSTLLSKKHIVVEMATNADFADTSRFEEMLRLLDDANNAMMAQLSGALRSVKRLLRQNLLDQSFPHYTALMRYLAGLGLRDQDLTDLAQVGDSLQNIQRVVEDAGKTAAVRDMKILESAMNTGYFLFKNQVEVQEQIDLAQHFDADQIGRSCLQLHAGITLYSCEQVENMIDRILLCRRNTEHNVQKLVKKLEICREINSLRVLFTRSGGREEGYGDVLKKKKRLLNKKRKEELLKQKQEVKGNGDDEEQANGNDNKEELKELIDDDDDDEENVASYLKTPVSLALTDYDEFRKQWQRRVTEWDTHVEILRCSSPLMNYFTINNVRNLIEKINRIIKHSSNHPMKKVLKKSSRSLAGLDEILQRHILPHFEFVNPKLKIEDLIHCLSKWKIIDESSNNALTAFDACFKGIIPTKLRDTKQFTRNVSPLEEGKPNLVVTSRNTVLFTTLKMYLQRKLIPNAEHILICQNTTSAEEIEAMIFRCIHATSRHSKIPPLYCLLYPEDLDIGVLDVTINIFNNRLLSPKALEQTSKIPYAFSVISADSENRLSQMLVQFKLTQSIQLRGEECINLLKYLFHDSLHEFARRTAPNPFISTKPYVQLYTSSEVGMGKSYVIQQHVKQCNATYIRIPFNGAEVDLDFVVNRCWSYHAYTDNLENDLERALIMNALNEANAKKPDTDAKDSKIIYHLDISANAGADLNNVLFNLLFLRHIHTPNQKCFSVEDNMAFLIEIPTQLSGVHALDVLRQNQQSITQSKAVIAAPHSVFYLLYKPMEFPSMPVSNDTNLFNYDYDSHYAGKFLRSFYGNELKQNDPDPGTIPNMSDDEIHALIYKHFQNIADSSPIHYGAFFKFLAQQFTQVVNSIFLRNEFNDGGQIAWKHWVTSSIIDIGKDFCRRLYGDDDDDGERKNKDDDKDTLFDESTGKEHFYLCERWKNAREPMFLLNQTCDFGYGGPDGSISALVSDKYTLPQEKRTALENSKFILIPWNEEEERRRHMLLQSNFMNELPQRKQEKINLFLRILGLDVENNVIHQSILISLLFEDPFANYALTFDNILKMVAIFFRVRANIPVILMGETGCGKTSLLRYLAKAASVEFCQADVHGGFTASHIRSKMAEWIAIAKAKQQEAAPTGQDVWVFLDEVNTSPDIGWFKEIVCDHSLDGVPLPYNMRIIAACNPYRRRKIINEQFRNWMAASGSDDPLSQFMYRVYPLPPTMKEYVWMFGSLSALDELQYVCEMVNNTVRKLPRDVQNSLSDWQRRRFIDAIVKSQEFVRDVLRDAAYVSLRDVARCLDIFEWLMSNELKFHTSQSWIERATVQSLALVYYFRLDSASRSRYAKRLTPDVCGRIAWFNNRDFETVLNDEIEQLCGAFEIPPGVALNKSLKENLFMLFLCILTATPLILVGKPGSSKTLAVSIIRDSLSEMNIGKVQQLGLPVQCIHIISFQCSKQSRAEGIRKRWEQALGHQLRDERVRLVLLLDEVGLAEHSPYRPLKVLHQLLESPEISFVGLSNWPLDAAKMNRANMHLCPSHTRADLEETAAQMLEQYSSVHINIERMKTELYALSKVYLDVLSNLQPRVDFFGARDFYSLVRYFLQSSDKSSKSSNENLMLGFLRNFGGIEDNLIHQLLSEIIERHMGIRKQDVQNVIRTYPPLTLVSSNIVDRRKIDSLTGTDNFMISRHCMVITESAHSWQVLLDQDVLSHNDTFIFGSEFTRDKSSSITFYANLNRVMNCMETGKTVVLHNLDDIHESLYDMLNQRYTVTRAGKMYCRVALGAESRTCFIDPMFKCIVLVSKYDAHQSGRVPIAFLNRFEKQLISYYSSLPYKFRSDVLPKLEIAICSKFAAQNKKALTELFPGFCNDTLPSVLSALIQKESSESESDNIDIIIQESVSSLLNVALPESVIEATVKTKKSPIQYLPTLRDTITSYENGDDASRMLMILTYDFESSLPKRASFLENTTIMNLDEFNKADEFDTFIRKHFTETETETETETKEEVKMDDVNIENIEEMKDLIKGDSLGDDEEKLNTNDDLRLKKAQSDPEKDDDTCKIKKKTLLLQYRHGSAGVQHFIHIKHMIELAYYQLSHHHHQHEVIFVVHLRRDTPSESFPLVLSRRWHMVFIDSLQQKEEIKLESIATESIGDIFEAQGIKILSQICRRSLSHLQFSTSVAPQQEITRLLRILSVDSSFCEFRDAILRRMSWLLSVDKLNIPIARLVVDNVRNVHSSGQWMRGSFYERFSDIVQKIVMVTLTNVLRSVYINNNFDTLFSSKSQNNELLYRLYIALFSNKDLVEISTISSTISLILENKPILVDVPYEYNAKFPFSSSINQWCSSQKSFLRSFREKEDDKDKDKDDGKNDDDEGDTNVIEGTPGNEEKKKRFETDTKIQRTKRISQFLTQFMKGSHDPLPLLTQLPHSLSQLYAHDLILLHRRQLPIDNSSSTVLIDLCSRFLMTITGAICGAPPKQDTAAEGGGEEKKSSEEKENKEQEPGADDINDLGNLQDMQHQDSLGDDEEIHAMEEAKLKDGMEYAQDEEDNKEDCFICVPQLQATIWSQSEFLMHFITISSLLDDEDKWRQIHDILNYSDLYSSRCSLLYALKYVLEFLNSSFSFRQYDKLARAQQSIPYLWNQVNKWLDHVIVSQIELDHVMNDLNKKWKCLKLKMLAVKHIGCVQRIVMKKKKEEKEKRLSGIFGKIFGGIMDNEEGKDDEKRSDEDANPLLSSSSLFARFGSLISRNCLIHKDTFCEILSLLFKTICSYSIDSKSKLNCICSNTLCDYLSLCDEMENVSDLRVHHLNYASCLLDLTVRHTKVIGMEIGTQFKWTDIAKLQLVRRLLNLSDYDAHGNVVKLINGAIFMYNKRSCGWDHELNTLIVRAFEERVNQNEKENKNQLKYDIKWISAKESAMKQLLSLAQIKMKLTYFISLISSSVVDVVNVDDIYDSICSHFIGINHLLSVIPSSTHAHWRYSLHIWFLKQMYNLRGMEWTEVLICNRNVRKSCAIFQESQVFKQLKRASANIPSLDTFATIGARYYMYSSSFHSALRKKTEIDIAFDSTHIKLERLAIIAALFSETYLLPQSVRDQLQSSFSIIGDGLVSMAQPLFPNGGCESFSYKFVHKLMNASFNKKDIYFCRKTAIEDVMILRLLVHFFVVIINNDYNPFYQLFIDPSSYLDSYLVSMPPDMLALVHNAIENKKTRIWLCPKGHPYLIGECGRPTVESKCHCGEVIGGKSHNPVENVKPVDDYKAASPKGYVLTGTPGEQKNVESFRQCKPYCIRLMRLFVHLSMLLHHVTAGDDKSDKLSSLIHQKYDDICPFLWSQIRSDLALLCSISSSNVEDVCIGIHFLLNDLLFKFKFISYDFRKEEDRDTFEQSFVAFIECQRAYHATQNSIISFRNENKNAAHLRLLMTQILEQNELNAAYRCSFVPHLFLRCESVSLSSFFSFVRGLPNSDRLYPNLWRIMHCRPLFWCLSYLPDLATWLRLIYERYLRKKTLDECREMTISDILSDAEINKWGDIAEWRRAWSKFRECWNFISSKTRQNAQYELEHECKTLVIPSFSSANESVSMIYSLPRDIGDGILILEIIKNLQNIHNEFLDEFLDNNTNTIRARRTLFNLRSDHCINISQSSLLQLIVSHSIPQINYGEKTAITFDLDAIESQIISTYISGRFAMEIDVRSFEFIGAQNSASLISLICGAIHQETLSFDIWQSFENQFEGAFQKRKCLDIFEETISFLSKTISILSGTMPICTLMQEMLSMNKSEYALFDADIQLKHIKSLWTYLTQSLARNDSKRSKAPQHTLYKYRCALNETIINDLLQFIKRIPLGLLAKIVIKWKNQLESYANIEYNIHTTTVNQFLFIDDDTHDIVLPKKVKFPTISLQYFATAFEYVATKFYKLSK